MEMTVSWAGLRIAENSSLSLSVSLVNSISFSLKSTIWKIAYKRANWTAKQSIYRISLCVRSAFRAISWTMMGNAFKLLLLYPIAKPMNLRIFVSSVLKALRFQLTKKAVLHWHLCRVILIKIAMITRIEWNVRYADRVVSSRDPPAILAEIKMAVSNAIH